MSCIDPPLLLVLPDHQRSGQEWLLTNRPTKKSGSPLMRPKHRRSNGTTATTSDQPIFCDIEQCLNNSTAGSVGDGHCSSFDLQVFQIQRGPRNEALTPVGRDAFMP
jgi:hypothetical protein